MECEMLDNLNKKDINVVIQLETLKIRKKS